MKQNQVERRLYEEPQIQVIGIEPYSCLLDISGAGGHNKAGDDGKYLSGRTLAEEKSQHPRIQQCYSP